MIRNRSFFSQFHYLLKYKPDSEFVPLYSLCLPTKEDNTSAEHYLKNDAEIKALYEHVKNSDLSDWINLHNISSRYNARNIEHSKEILNSILGQLQNYVSSETVDEGLYRIWERYYPKSHLHKFVSGEEHIEVSAIHCQRTYERFYCGNMFIAKNIGTENYPKIKPIFMMVVRRECIEYVKLCHILKKQPLASAFEFWIQKGFDTKETTETYVRTYIYRKHIKKALIEKGIPIIEKDNMLDELYKIRRQPKVKTLSERKEWLNNMSMEFTKYLNPQPEEVELPDYFTTRHTFDAASVLRWQEQAGIQFVGGTDPISPGNGESFNLNLERQYYESAILESERQYREQMSMIQERLREYPMTPMESNEGESNTPF